MSEMSQNWWSSTLYLHVFTPLYVLYHHSLNNGGDDGVCSSVYIYTMLYLCIYIL